MFLAFTPYTYLFMLFYFLVLSFLFTISNFYIFWMYMEILMLIFMGVCYTLFVNSFSNLMIYFLVQTLASFNIFVFYIFDMPYLCYLAVFMKLAMFPFFSWYINVLYRFTNYPLFLASSFHKLPPLLILFYIPLVNSTFLLTFVLITIFVSGCIMLFTSDVRYILVVSSMGNNGWFIMSTMADYYLPLAIFFTFYCANVFFILNKFSNLSKLPMFANRSSDSNNLYVFSLFTNLAGLPPMPMFFVKLYVIASLMSSCGFDISLFIILILLSNSLTMIAYIQCIIKLFINKYTVSSNLLLF